MLFRRAPQKVEELKIVIVGAGEVGFHIAQRLSEEQKQVVVIDQNPDKLRRIEDNMDVQTVLGSGSIPSVLKNAGAGDAAIFLAVTDSDETNIVACLFANTIAPFTKIFEGKGVGFGEGKGKRGGAPPPPFFRKFPFPLPNLHLPP
jgi:trk system potassium uptake protein